MVDNEISALSMSRLTKSYGDFVLGPLDFRLEIGSVTALVGPNGAGKTTTLNCVTGLVQRDGGDLDVFGVTPHPDRTGWKKKIGHVGEHRAFYEAWTAAENLRFIGTFYPQWSWDRASAMARRLRLPLDTRAGALSKGNRTKLAIVAALAHAPSLLLLDEPFAGLDPAVRGEALDLLWECLETHDVAILYSTHVIADVSRLADDVAFLNEGQLLLRTPKDDLTDRWGRIGFQSTVPLDDIPAAVQSRRQGVRHQVVSCDSRTTLEHLRASGASDIEVARMTLDEIAVEIIKEGETSWSA